MEPVGALNRDQPRAQHTVQDNHSLSYIENCMQPREGRRGGGGGCGVVEVDYGDGPGTVQEQTTPDDRAEDGNPRGADKKRNKRERQR